MAHGANLAVVCTIRFFSREALCKLHVFSSYTQFFISASAPEDESSKGRGLQGGLDKMIDFSFSSASEK